MSHQLIFATGNPNKVKEIRFQLQGAPYVIKSLKDLGVTEEIPEPFETLEENAKAKVDYLVSKFDKPCFSEDTGLEVEALDGEPGVRSARYAGADKNAEDNIQLLLENMDGVQNRKARFRTVICYFDGTDYHYFEGIVKGRIIEELLGTGGFGYDPVFIPEDKAKTFAEMDAEEKIQISHRGRAFKRFLSFLKRG